jgi:hypothetical protein
MVEHSRFIFIYHIVYRTAGNISQRLLQNPDFGLWTNFSLEVGFPPQAKIAKQEYFVCGGFMTLQVTKEKIYLQFVTITTTQSTLQHCKKVIMIGGFPHTGPLRGRRRRLNRCRFHTVPRRGTPCPRNPFVVATEVAQKTVLTGGHCVCI